MNDDNDLTDISVATQNFASLLIIVQKNSKQTRQVKLNSLSHCRIIKLSN